MTWQVVGNACRDQEQRKDHIIERFGIRKLLMEQNQDESWDEQEHNGWDHVQIYADSLVMHVHQTGEAGGR